MNYQVWVWSDETGEVVKKIDAGSMHRAEKIEDGVMINLGDDYYTTIEQTEED